jgi:hypothetical protein
MWATKHSSILFYHRLQIPICVNSEVTYAVTSLIFQAILMGIGLQHKTMEDLEVAICLCTKMDIAE